MKKFFIVLMLAMLLALPSCQKSSQEDLRNQELQELQEKLNDATKRLFRTF